MQNPTPTGKLLSIGESSEYLGVSIDTLRRWEKKGRINPLRSPGGHRYYSKEDLDALFGKRYTRDEETLRRTNEELGGIVGAHPDVRPLSVDTPNIPAVEADLVSAQKTAGATPAPPESIPTENHPSGEIQFKNTDKDFSRRVDDRIETVGATPLIPESSDHSESLPTAPEVIPPQEPPVQEPEKPVSSSETISETDIHNKIPLDANVGATRESPESSIPEIPLDTEGYNAVAVPSSAYPTGTNVLLPAKEDGNSLSEEEIERRIHTIITKEKKKTNSNIFLAIGAFIMLAVDVVLLYLWFTSSRISSPIP